MPILSVYNEHTDLLLEINLVASDEGMTSGTPIAAALLDLSGGGAALYSQTNE